MSAASAPAFSSSDVGAVQREYDAAGLGRLTWLGLAVAAIGWALLLAEAMAGDLVAAKAGRPVTATFHGDLVTIAECLIGSGFGLAILGGLQTGFGALNRFFAAVLTRSAGRAAAPPGPSMDAAPTAEPMREVDRDAEPLRERRPYQILADGSVEVETIVGTRRFDSMHEARDFI